MVILLDYCDIYNLRKPKIVQLIVLVHISVIIYICNYLYLCVCVCGRCGSEGNRSSSEDIGPGREGSSSEYRGAPSCSSHAGLCLSRDGGLGHANPRSPRSPSVPWWCREPAEISTGRTTHITCIPPLNNTQITTDVHPSARTFIQWQVDAKVEVWLHSYPKKNLFIFIWGQNSFCLLQILC